MSNAAQIYPNPLTQDSSGNVTVTGNLTVSGNEAVTGTTALTGATTLTGTLTTGTGGVQSATVDPTVYEFAHDWDQSATFPYTTNGNAVFAAVNSVSAPLLTNSNMGVAYVNTSSTTAGGYATGPNGYPIIKSTTLNYQWRIVFYHPVASTAANTYTSYVGGFLGTGTANNANAGPLSGPFIKYSHGLNGGNFVLGSSVNGTITTGNSSTAATNYLGAWNVLTITLANGTYTFTLANVGGGNSAALGTLLDNNITTSVANLQTATYGGIMILPDGTNFTTNRVLMIDRSDFRVTGLTR